MGRTGDWSRRVLGLLALVSAAAPAQQPSPEQIRRFQQLSPDQQQSIIRSASGGGGAALPGQPARLPPAAAPAVQASRTPSAASVAPDTEARIRRLKSGDTILLRLTVSRGQAMELDVMAAEGTPPEKSGKRSAVRESTHVLDSSGAVQLPEVGRILIGGLTEKQASELLAAEPAYDGIKVAVRLLPVRAEISPFGYGFFDRAQSPDALYADIPVPADYVIGPGDSVIVQLYGKEQQQYELTVTREGLLQFPGIGPIRVAGISFAQLQRVLGERIRRQFIGMNSSITVGRTRTIQIFVLGDVVNPGAYMVSGMSTLTNAIFASGGIKTIGSMRDLQLKRAGKTVSRMDLYDMLLRGDNSADVRLLPGDVVFVPPIGKTVGIAGEVQRPAIYEIREEDSLEQLVVLAGGFTPEAFPEKAQIERIFRGRERVTLDVDLRDTAGRRTDVQNGDIVRVLSVLERPEQVVFLSGYVHRPGTYQWRAGMRLSDLIASLGDLPPNVDTRYLLVKREAAQDRSISLLSADLAAALAAPRGPADPVLQSRDTVFVFSIHEDRSRVVHPLLDIMRAQARPDRPAAEVTVSGIVHQDGRYPLTAGMRVSDLIRAGGGLDDAAYELEAELTRYTVVDGRTRKQATQPIELAAALSGTTDKDLALAPYDQLVVKRIPLWRKTERVTITGEVNFPGAFPLARGEKLSDVLKRAGGLTDKGYARGAVLVRETVRAREKLQFDRLAAQLEEDLAAAANEATALGEDKAAALAQGKVLLRQLRGARAVGRVTFDLERVLGGDPEYDIALQDGDRLFIPVRPDEVTVAGEVYFSTSHLYRKGLGYKDYLKQSGGLTERANDDSMYVVHSNGAVSPVGGWFSDAPSVGPGDTVVVPMKIDRVSSLRLATDISQIVYHLAVSAATLKFLGIFH